MGIIRWMSAEGDTALTWDQSDPLSLERAREALQRALREGRGVFSMAMDGVGVRLRGIDEFAELPREVVVIPQIRGG
jgi:hypothetical protein